MEREEASNSFKFPSSDDAAPPQALMPPFEPALPPPLNDDSLEEAELPEVDTSVHESPLDKSYESSIRKSPVQRPQSAHSRLSPVSLSHSPSSRGHHRRSSSRLMSPVSLPIRSAPSENEETPRLRRSKSPSKAVISRSPSPNRSMSPGKFSSPSKFSSPAGHGQAPKISPRKSFYLEKSIPTPEDGLNGFNNQATAPSFDPGLIFDDKDTRLPPPEDSPSHLPATEADILAISSPEGPSSRLDDQFEHDYGYLSTDDLRASEVPTDEISYRDLNGDATSFEWDPEYLDEVDLHETVPEIIRSPSGRMHPNYPAPLPQRLMRPPRLSSRKHSHSASIEMPPPPDWGQNPEGLETEYEFVTTDAANSTVIPYNPSDYAEESDVDSDRATIMSDDRDDLEDIEKTPTKVEESPKKKKKKGKWYNPFKSKRKNEDEGEDEMGDTFDEKEHNVVRQQMAVIDDDFAFSRLDPETIERHVQMFNTGGMYSSIAPQKGGTTSLIEELEIRKAGRKMQRQILLREVSEIERQRQEDAANTNWAHPAGADPRDVQPTLLQMQYMADIDYQNRVQWHKRETNKNYIHEHADETLAQRRARLKAEKQQHAIEELSQPAVQETLAERRARLRREKLSSRQSVYSMQTTSTSGDY